jgi:hypothetical protein
MHQSSLHRTVAKIAILLSTIACALPAQTIQPTSEINSNARETAMVSTLQSAVQQTEQASPITATTTVVAADTSTPTPKISVSGTSLIVREDQSTLFIDYKAGIQLVIPAGWMALRVNEEEYLKAFGSDIVLQNPTIFNRLTHIRDSDTNYFRLDAIDVRPGHMPDGMLSIIDVAFQPDDFRSLEQWEQTERNRYYPWADLKFISANYPQLANGRQVLVIEQSWSAGPVNGNRTYHRNVFFSLPSGTVVLDFYTNNDFKDTVLPDFDQVVNSLTLINP